MIVKTRVSKEVGIAIDNFKKMQKEKFNITDIDELFSIATDWWNREEFHEFRDLQYVHELKFIDFCNAFYYGYEIEYTSEEKIKELCKEHSEKHLKYVKENNNYNLRYHQGYVFGMCEALEILGKKIDGVNINF
ncbi:hypothetical protein ACQKNX_07685 [Lysinibacillus sp. NPDC093712]|uniref:hypothetical protein n=1 Tax=Lysinibacillus sp. NPDC093712 TaxID=3390579 RepID=UPI003CFC892F